mgnify:CR=1 FL=1
MPVLWLFFTLEYSGRSRWLTQQLVAIALIIPLISQTLLWSSDSHSLWLIQDVVFQPVGNFWIFLTHTRIPGFGYLLFVGYGLLLQLTGILIILNTTWRERGINRAQLLTLAVSSALAVSIGVIAGLNPIPTLNFNFLTPGIGLSSLLFAIAIFRFRFLKHIPVSTSPSSPAPYEIQEKRSLILILVIFAITAAGISAIGWISYLNYERDFRGAVEKQLSAITELKIKDLQNWKEERLHDAETIYNNPTFAALVLRFFTKLDDQDARHQLQHWIQSIQRAYHYERVFLIDTLGHERLSSPPQPEPITQHLREDIPKVLESNTITFVDFHRDQEGGAIFLSILIPVHADPDAEIPLGILVLRIDPYDFLYPSLMSWPGHSETAETLLVRRNGSEVVYLNPLRFNQDAALNLRILLEHHDVLAVKAVMGQTGITEGLDYRGNRVIGVLSTIPDTPWYLVTRMDTSEVYAPLRERIWLTTVTIGTLVIAAGAGLISLWRQQRMAYYKDLSRIADSLRVSEERLRLALAAANQGLYDLNVQTGEAIVNEEYAKMLGYDPATFHETNAAWIERLHPDDREPVAAVYRNYIAGLIPEYRVEFRQRTASGDWVWILSLGKVVERDDQGRPLRMLGIHTDITERKKQENRLLETQTDLQRLLMEMEERVANRTAQLAASNRELEAFAYSVSHDLRAPLRAIDGFSRILYQEYAGRLDEEGKRLLEIIRANTARMDQLIKDLLALSRVSRVELNYTTIDMTSLVHAVYQEIALPEEKQSFRFTVDPLPPAFGDAILLRQVWTNLISNAIKYTLPKKERIIHISSDNKDGVITYSIKDSGVGFNPQYANKLFQLFQRLHKAGDFEGTGVGLAIVQRIIHRHGGQVWGEGIENQGAVFSFTIPDKRYIDE